jgi:glycosyltransferase involved in cell wall biosynthesis
MLRARDGSQGAGIEHYTRMISSALLRLAPDQMHVVLPIGNIPFISRHAIVPLLARMSGSDILLCPSGQIPLGWFGRSAIVIHDLAIYEHPEWFPGSGSLLDARSIRRAETIIAVSDATRQQIARLFPDAAGKIVVVHPGVETPTLARGRVGQEDIVLFVGTIEPRKNLVNAIAAFDAFLRMRPERSLTTRFVIAGKTGWKAEPVLEAIEQTNAAWMRKAGGNVIRPLGYVTEDEKRSLYAQASCLFFPSLYEGFGLPALEAMAVGTPVIVSDRGALPEVCGDAALYVDPENVEQMALALTQCTMLPDAMDEMVILGRKRAGEFTWERCANRILAALGKN